MRCPASDPGFATNPIHGAAAQLILIKQVLRHVKGRGLALDIGAHIGTWTIPLAGQFRYVVALEPQPENYACLLDNLEGIDNVAVVQAAAGASEAHASLAVTENSGTYFLTKGEGVQVVRLDDIALPGTAPVDFIKLDVEGMEGAALQGATGLLTEYKPAVFFEDNGLGAQHYGPDWIDPKTVLQQHGYYHRGRMAKNELWLPR